MHTLAKTLTMRTHAASCRAGDSVKMVKYSAEMSYQAKKSPYNDTWLPFVFQVYEHVYKTCHSVAGVHACLLNLVLPSFHYHTVS